MEGVKVRLFNSVIFLIEVLERSSPSRTAISRPKTGPSSRGGKGGYKKRCKGEPDVSPNSKISKNLRHLLIHQWESYRQNQTASIFHYT